MVAKQGHRGWGHIRRLPSKRFQASYIGPDLARHKAPKTFSTRIDAEYWLSNERRLVERDADGDDAWTAPAVRSAKRHARGIALAGYWPTWLASRRGRGGVPLKPRTVTHYTEMFDKHIKPTFGAQPLRHITEEAVNDWHSKLLPGKPTMRAHTYSLLHAVLASAVREGHIGTNPATNTDALKAERATDPVILTVQQVADLADAIEPRFKAFVLISAWMGTRWGETTELRRGDIAKDYSSITVARGVTHRTGCHTDTPKSGKARVVTVPPHIRGDIKHHIKTYVAADAEALLFPPARGGCHLNDKVFRDYFQDALKTIGVEGVRVHHLRHFAGTQVARVANLPETMKALGHSTIDASLRYQAIAEGRDAEIAAALSKLAVTPPEAPDTDNG